MKHFSWRFSFDEREIETIKPWELALQQPFGNILVWHHIFIKAYLPVLFCLIVTRCAYHCSPPHTPTLHIPARVESRPHFHVYYRVLKILRQISRIRFIFWSRFACYFHLATSAATPSFNQVIFTHSTHSLYSSSQTLSLSLFHFHAVRMGPAIRHQQKKRNNISNAFGAFSNEKHVKRIKNATIMVC